MTNQDWIEEFFCIVMSPSGTCVFFEQPESKSCSPNRNNCFALATIFYVVGFTYIFNTKELGEGTLNYDLSNYLVISQLSFFGQSSTIGEGCRTMYRIRTDRGRFIDCTKNSIRAKGSLYLHFSVHSLLCSLESRETHSSSTSARNNSSSSPKNSISSSSPPTTSISSTRKIMNVTMS